MLPLSDAGLRNLELEADRCVGLVAGSAEQQYGRKRLQRGSQELSTNEASLTRQILKKGWNWGLLSVLTVAPALGGLLLRGQWLSGFSGDGVFVLGLLLGKEGAFTAGDDVHPGLAKDAAVGAYFALERGVLEITVLATVPLAAGQTRREGHGAVRASLCRHPPVRNESIRSKPEVVYVKAYG